MHRTNFRCSGAHKLHACDMPCMLSCGDLRPNSVPSPAPASFDGAGGRRPVSPDILQVHELGVVAFLSKTMSGGLTAADRRAGVGTCRPLQVSSRFMTSADMQTRLQICSETQESISLYARLPNRVNPRRQYSAGYSCQAHY